MAMSDCPKCWETPCACGHEYRSWSLTRIEDLIATLNRIRDEKVRQDASWDDPGCR